MDFRDTALTLLPPPRDDEPASLRQDILDELSDHVVCAHNRELLRGVDSSVARQRVLERFGDPAAVARRLWFDAMKGKIMAQRVLIATCLVVMLASLSLVGMIWHLSSVAQRNAADAAAVAVQAMALQNEKAQVAQQEMLKQMREMSESIRSTRSLDWNPVTFRLSEDTLEGPPVAGVAITLEQRAVAITGSGSGPGGGMGQGPTTPILRVTDGSGIADFGVVHPGNYDFRVFKNDGQEYLATSGAFSIEPGTQFNKRIVCPKVPLERVPVRVRASLPGDLEKEKLVLCASFALKPIHRDTQWWALSQVRPGGPASDGRFPPSWSRLWPANHTVLCGPAMSMAQILPNKAISFWALSGRPHENIWADMRSTDLRELREPADVMEWERGTYELSGVIVLRPTRAAVGHSTKTRFDVLFMSQSHRRNLFMNHVVLDKPPAADDHDEPLTKNSQTRAWPDIEGNGNSMGRSHSMYFQDSVPWESWSAARTSFELRPGPTNEYAISLPDEVIEIVRAKLKADLPPKPQ
jgi:hypothetical protein